jgi:fatty acid desaturase
VAVAVATYGGWIALTLFHRVLPWPVIAAAGGWLVAWHGSLQHETIHGHPTRSLRLNTVIGFVPLSLWLPYAIYRRSHIAHHGSAWITHPARDPESRYVTGERRVQRWAAVMQATLVGRLVFGPLVCIASFFAVEARRLKTEPRLVMHDWVPHLAAVILVGTWLEATGFGIARYSLLAVYPGTALTLLRSFAEHRADIDAPGKAATVERGGLLGVLFLNNHLHAAHHDRPGLSWYRLPAHHRRHRLRLAGAGGRSYRGYGEIVRRFALRPHDAVIHPDRRTS